MIITRIIANVDEHPGGIGKDPEKCIRVAMDGDVGVTFAGIPNGTSSGATTIGIAFDLPDSDKWVFLEVKADTLRDIAQGLWERHGRK